MLALGVGLSLAGHVNMAWGQQPLEILGDLDRDRDVDQADLGVLRGGLGRDCPPPAELVVHTPFDGNAADSSDYGNHGTVYGVTWDTDRKVGTHSARFDGANNYVRIPGGHGSKVDFHDDSFSIAFWVKFRLVGTANVKGQCILKKGETSRYEFQVSYPSGSGPEPRLVFTIHDGVTKKEIKHSAVQSATVFGGKWVHVAVSRDAAADVMKYYINGVLVAMVTEATTGDISSHAHDLIIGANQRADGNWLDGWLDDLRIYDKVLGEDEVQFIVASGRASSPDPADEAGGVSPGAVLRWSPGTHALAHDVYLGTSERAVASATRSSEEYKGNRTETSYVPPGGLEIGGTYYWRIDEIDACGQYGGDAWKFTVCPIVAWGPGPADGARYATSAVALTWSAGCSAVSHDVYLGTSLQAVAEATRASDEYKGNQTQTTYVPPGGLKYKTTYYWRIDEIGASSTSRGQVWSFTTAGREVLTFLFCADQHYGLRQLVDNEGVNKATIDDMNALAGTAYPQATGWGLVQAPRGVLVAGDLTDNGRDPQWNGYGSGGRYLDGFVNDYGIDGEGRINYPVYEGYGNHDGNNAVIAGIITRNPRRPGNLNISGNGVHYSWDWHQVHFVNLNVYPGEEDLWEREPMHSLSFLIQDLAANVGSSGRPVLLYHHYGFDSLSTVCCPPRFWADWERDAYYNAIKEYNVIGIFHGHLHGTKVYTWKGIDVYNVGAAKDRSFFVARITENALTVAEHIDGHWGVTSEKSISFPPAP